MRISYLLTEYNAYFLNSHLQTANCIPADRKSQHTYGFCSPFGTWRLTRKEEEVEEEEEEEE